VKHADVVEFKSVAEHLPKGGII